MLSVVVRAALLDRRVYSKFTQDPMAIVYAFGTVVATAAAFGVGMWILAVRELEESPSTIVPVAIVTILVGWIVWSLVNYLVGARLLGGEASYRQILRALGVCYGPGVLMVLTGVPVVGLYITSVATLWIFAAGVVAIRETQGISWVQALISVMAGWIPSVWIVSTVLFGPES